MSPSFLRLAAVVAVQIAILAAVPASQVKARISGTDVTLATGPIDPFDPFAGHHVILSYLVERPGIGQAPTGLGPGDPVFVTVARAEPAWTLVSITRERPAPSSGHASLRARWGRFGRAEIDSARRFYLPEEKARRVQDAMNALARQRASATGLVDMRVDEAGNVALLRLRVGDVSVGY